nr:DUF5694 domain-containing protein [uncultured Psychroserpens sp.]
MRTSKTLNFIIILFMVVFIACDEKSKPDIKEPKANYNRLIWPEPKPHEIEVMVLGVYHMSNPHLDANNVNSDDVRTKKRQEELQELAEKLALFKPDLIATEVNYKSQGMLDSLYLEVPIDTILTKYRNEAIQIGCRLGKMLNLPKVHAIDFPMMLGNDSLRAFYLKHNKNIPHKLKYPKLNWEKINKQGDSLLYASTITEYLIEKNKEDNHIRNHYGMFGDLRKGENDNFGGARNLARWYERNFKMIHNIYRAATPKTKRVLLIVGSGHVSPLRHILDDSPMFCPVSPMPYLTN